MSFSNHLENITLDCIFGKIWYSPQILWLGLSRADPLDTGYGMDEPWWVDPGEPEGEWKVYSSGDPVPPGNSGYMRVVCLIADWISAYDGMVANAQALTFPTATKDWGLMTHFALFDEWWMILHGELSPQQQVNAGQRPRFNPTKLEIFLS